VVGAETSRAKITKRVGTLPPMSERELRHYDESMTLAQERLPLLPPDAPDDERRQRARNQMAYAAILRDGWTDDEHRRRMGSITASIRSTRRRPSPSTVVTRIVRVAS
jgi:hypothetical protein